MTSIQKELARLAKENGGVLLPDKVVESARKKASPLHGAFQWDDTKAAHEYRLFQARRLIKAAVTIFESGGEEIEVSPSFVSLRADRAKPGGGYRLLTTVLSDEDMRAQLLEEALDDMRIFRDKYKRLKELAEVFTASEKAEKKIRKRSRK